MASASKPYRPYIDKAMNIKHYHCLRLVEALVYNNTKLAEKHLVKLINTRLGNKISYALRTDELI